MTKDQLAWSAVGGPERRRPAAICLGPGLVVVYGNPAFVAVFGAGAVGVPALEGLVGLPREAMATLDAVLAHGRPLARWITWADGHWRLTVAPRIDLETGQPYGVSLHLRVREDMPVRPAESAG